jgi:hypothetical protein
LETFKKFIGENTLIMTNTWIQKALKKHKPKILHKQLGIPIREEIPLVVLYQIAKSKIGDRIYINTAKIISNTPFITVTKLLKKRAVLALNLRKISERR